MQVVKVVVHTYVVTCHHLLATLFVVVDNLVVEDNMYYLFLVGKELMGVRGRVRDRNLEG